MDFKRSWGNVFHQLEFDDPFDFLSCSAVDDITVPEGDVTLKYEPHPGRSGKFRVSSQIVGEPGTPTMSIVRPLQKVWNYLMETECAANYRVNWVCRGDRTVKTNYDVAFVLLYAMITNRNIPTPTALEPDDEERVETNADLGGMDATMLYKLNGSTQTNSFTQAINDMAFLPMACEGVCGDRIGLGDVGYCVMDAAGYLDYSEVEVGFTEDGGSTWSAVSGEPFTNIEDLTSVVLKDLADDHRVIVGRSAIAGLPPAISYSDDEGATWTPVDLPGVNGDGVNALTKDRDGAIWAVCDDGYIFKSTDMANSWTAKEEAVETSEDLNDIAFVMTAMFGDEQVGYVVGDSNAFLYTEDGGDDWAAGVGPATGVNLLSVAVNRFGHVFVGTNDARVFRSTDGPDTDADSWVEIADHTAGSINSIDFDPEFHFFGAYSWDNASPVGTVYRTEDGGASWYATLLVGTTPTNQGINVVKVPGTNMIYAGGELLAGGTPFIGKFTRRG